MNDFGKLILVTGGCGYIGSVLVPKLAQKYQVTVLDSMLFGNYLPPLPEVKVIQGDIRDSQLIRSLLSNATDVIHLAAIANDPCSDLDPTITCEVNRNAIIELVKIAKECGVRRFINASSSSVYGVKQEQSVTEDLELEPITLYAKLKAETEQIVSRFANHDFITVSIRSATVCGYSPRMRFDVIVNIIAKSAIIDGVINVHGGKQFRPNIHIDDITNLYTLLLEIPEQRINGLVFNVGSTNYTVMEIAEMARDEIGAEVHVNTNATDNRSYRISSDKIKRELGYEPKKTIRQAMVDIRDAFARGCFPEPNHNMYYNIRTMKELKKRNGLLTGV